MPGENIIEHAAVQISPSFVGFQAEYRKKLGNITPRTFRVQVWPDFRGFQAEYRKKLAAIRPRQIDVKVDVKVTGDKDALAHISALVSATQKLNAATDAKKKASEAAQQAEARHLNTIRDLQAKIQDTTRDFHKYRDVLPDIKKALELNSAEYRRLIERNKELSDIQNKTSKDRVDQLQAELAMERFLVAEIARRSREIKKTDTINTQINQKQERDRARLLSSDEGDFASGLIETGRRGIRPMTAIIGAITAISPALLSMASSAVQASTAFTAMAPAAFGLVTSLTAVGVAAQGIIGAFKLLDNVEKGSEAAFKELQQRLERMSPAARVLFGQILALREAFRGFAQAVETVSLPGLTELLSSIQQKGKDGISVLDLFSKAVIDMGATIGHAAAAVGEFVRNPLFRGQFVQIIDNNQIAFDALNRAAVSLLQTLTRIFAGASPLVAKFSKYVEQLTERFAAFVDSVSDSQIEGFFRRAGNELGRWWQIAVNLVGSLYDLMSASLPAGQNLVQRLLDFTAAIRDWTSAEANAQKIREFFDFFGRIPFAAIAAGLAAVAGGLAAVAVGGLAKTVGALSTGGIITAVITAGLLALGAAATTAYLNIQPFRDLVNETIATLSRMWNVIMSKVKPALDQAFVSLGAALERNKPELESMLKLFEELAPVVGEVLAASIMALADTWAFLIDVIGLAYKAWLWLEIGMLQGIKYITQGILDIARTFVQAVADIARAAAFASKFGLGSIFGSIGGWDTATKELDGWVSGLETARVASNSFFDGIIEKGEKALSTANAVSATKPTIPGQRESGEGRKKEESPPVDQPQIGKILYDPAALQSAKDQAADALQDAKSKVKQAKDSILDAYDAIRQGQREQVAAQRELNQTRLDAIKHIRELRLQVKGLAADEEEARLKVLYAREKLKSFEFTNAVDPLVRRSMRSELSSAEADLNDKIGKGAQLRAELALAEKRGVENAPEVLRAKQRIAELTDQQAKKYRDLRKAQDDATTAAGDLRKAQRDAVIAQSDLTTAVNSGAVAYDKFGRAIKALPKNPIVKFTVIPAVGTPEELHAAKGVVSVVELQKLFRYKAATGGPVYGRGGPKQDNIPAMLSAGEYVHTAEATKYYGRRNMAAINSKRIPRRVLEQYGYDRPKFAGGGYVWPLPGYHRISDGFGVDRGRYTHGGNDYPAPAGTRIVSIAAGRVIQSGWYGGGGNTVSIAYAGNLVARYMHMQRILANLNDVVKAGQVIGLVDNTGDSQGHHLHFQTERPAGNKIDPGRVLAGVPDRGALPGGILGALAPVVSKGVAGLIAVLGAGQLAGMFAASAVNALGGKVPVPTVTDKYLLPGGVFDRGGTIGTGPTLVMNRTGRPETIRNANQEAALHNRTIRLDKRDIQLLASILAVAAAQRPIEMDGTSVAKQVSSHQYLPRGV